MVYSHLVSATNLAVYDGIAPEGAGTEYIIMTGRTGSQDQGKSGFTSTTVIVVDIVQKMLTLVTKRAGNYKRLVLNAINSNSSVTLPGNVGSL